MDQDKLSKMKKASIWFWLKVFYLAGRDAWRHGLNAAEMSGADAVLMRGIVWGWKVDACRVLIDEGAIVIGCRFDYCDIYVMKHSILWGCSSVQGGSSIMTVNDVNI